MDLLNTLIGAADEEQLSLRPLPEHAASGQEEHLRRHYALLLAAVLTAQPAVSELQTRLLRLLLDALKLGDIRGPLFEQARELLPDQLLEAARLIREAGFAHHLVVDVLVLLRLDAPLGDEVMRVAGELASFLGLDEIALAQRVANAVDILGLNSPTGTQSEREDPGAEDAAHGSPLLAELWPSRLSQPLTAEALRSGLQGGLWLLDANLNVDFPWQADDAILVFSNGAMLNTFAKEGEIKLTGCRLADAALDFQGACSITLERCDWQGDYDPAAERTALNSIGQALTVTDCAFSTRNARAIAVQDNGLTLTGSRFTRCGHAELDGGAVEHTGKKDTNKRIENCRFFECQGSAAGAIYMRYFNGVKNCEFIACTGVHERPFYKNNNKKTDIAVYSGNYDRLTPLEGCVFRENSVYVYIYKPTVVASNTQFIEANLYFGVDNYGEPETTNCTFTKGRIEKI